MIVLCGAIEQGADALLGHLDGSFYGLAQRRFEFGSGCASGHAASSRQAARRAQRPWVCAIFVLAQVSSKKARRHPPRWCLHRPGVFVEVETVLLACIQAFLQFSQGIMRQLVAEAAFRDMRIGETCR